METKLVRLKAFDPRRGQVLRRFLYAGIKFYAERGWYRVEKTIADHLGSVRQRAGDPHAPLAFDVGTDSEAKVLDAQEEAEHRVRLSAAEDPKLEVARPPRSAEPKPSLKKSEPKRS
jgi:hypothetical protein